MRSQEIKKYLSEIGRTGGLKRTDKKTIAVLGNLEKANLKKELKKQMDCFRAELDEAYEIYSLYLETFNNDWQSEEIRGATQRIHAKIRATTLEIAKLNGGHTDEEWNEVLLKNGKRCPHCGEEKILTKDHIIPISQGGNDSIKNLRPLCRECNIKSYHAHNGYSERGQPKFEKYKKDLEVGKKKYEYYKKLEEGQDAKTE